MGRASHLQPSFQLTASFLQIQVGTHSVEGRLVGNSNQGAISACPLVPCGPCSEGQTVPSDSHAGAATCPPEVPVAASRKAATSFLLVPGCVVQRNSATQLWGHSVFLTQPPAPGGSSRGWAGPGHTGKFRQLTVSGENWEI